MIVYRVLDIPKMYPINNSEVWGVMCLLLPWGEKETIEDVVLFDEEDMAWKFYHECTLKFEPIKILDEDNVEDV